MGGLGAIVGAGAGALAANFSSFKVNPAKKECLLSILKGVNGL